MMHLSLLQLAISRSDTDLLELDLPAPWFIQPWNEGKDTDLSHKPLWDLLLKSTTYKLGRIFNTS